MTPESVTGSTQEATTEDAVFWFRIAALSGGVGVALRFLLAATTLGTNDIVTWAQFVRMIRSLGMLQMYSLETTGYWNHPPLAGYLALLADDIARLSGAPFSFIFKLGPVFADTMVIALLWRSLSSRSVRLAALTVAAFSLSPAAILVSGFHGNLDPIVGAMVLLSACALERGEHRRSGVLLGLAINLKLIPIVLVPVLLGRSWTDHRAREAFSGLAISAIPFVVFLIGDAPGFAWHLFGYRPPFDNWGSAFLVRLADGSSGVMPSQAPHLVGESLGRVLVVLAAIAAGLLAAVSRRTTAVEVYALGLAGFLVFSPGFGVQWTAILGAVMVAHSWKWGGSWGVSAGAFLGGVYLSFKVDDAPKAFSWFDGPLPMPWAWVGLFAWLLLLVFAGMTVDHLLEGGDRDAEAAGT